MYANNTKKEQLATRIAHLQLNLQPLVPLPVGDPHPDFPRTLLEYHLLTEEQLDSIASYYHQSTPCIWTHHYPTCMNWDKDFLSKRRNSSTRRPSHQQESSDWWTKFSTAAAEQQQRKISVQISDGMTDVERLAIKRRKVGKFIGLVGCETPDEEIEGRLRRAMEMARECAREEMRRAEMWDLRRSKMG